MSIREVKQDMIRTRIAVLAVVAGMLLGSAAYADLLPAPLAGLTVGSPEYWLAIHESGSGSGTIQQFDTTHNTTTSIAVTSGVGYSLPEISVHLTQSEANANLPADRKAGPFWGVCIDTREWSLDPQGAYLRQGWEPSHTDGDLWIDDPYSADLTKLVPATGRLNGTVLNRDAWNRTTYLFSQFGAKIGLNIADGGMTNVQKAAFQLATWEVMSGDGSDGANWGSGNFRASGVAALDTQANAYVAAAYNAGFSNWSDTLADQSLYFSGVFVNTGGQGPAYQDYLFYAPAPSTGGSHVPEIPAVALGPLGLMALGLLKRRFVK